MSVDRLQCGNMAREGLRTLVVSKKTLTEEQYQDFEVRYFAFNSSLQSVVEAVFITINLF